MNYKDLKISEEEIAKLKDKMGSAHVDAIENIAKVVEDIFDEAIDKINMHLQELSGSDLDFAPIHFAAPISAGVAENMGVYLGGVMAALHITAQHTSNKDEVCIGFMGLLSEIFKQHFVEGFDAMCDQHIKKPN